MILVHLNSQKQKELNTCIYVTRVCKRDMHTPSLTTHTQIPTLPLTHTHTQKQSKKRYEMLTWKFSTGCSPPT